MGLVVTEVVDQHLARAKVELDNYDFRKTLLPGDKIYSPAWRPGRTVGFALVGMMDINGDNKDDANQVRELIRMSGGKVDAEVDSQGVRNNKLPGMTPNTSFLVLGAERRVVFDMVNVIQGEAKLQQALIRDKRVENLWLLPASQTRDKDALTPEGVEKIIGEIMTAKHSERITRIIDHDQDGSMEIKKREGYF